MSGNFELIPPNRTKDVWDALVSQEPLSTMTIDKNLALGKVAWAAGGDASNRGSSFKDTAASHSNNRKLADLCDDALRCWVAAFLLGEPILRRSDSAFG